MKKSPFNNELSLAYSYIATVDLSKGLIEVLKSQAGNAQRQYYGVFDKGRQKEQVERYVTEEYRKEYLEFIDMSTVAGRLKKKESLTFIFQRPDGKWTMSVIVPQNTDENGDVTEVVIANRDITAIRKWEYEQKESLENALSRAEEALARVTKSSEIISAISTIYWAIYVIYLEDDTYEEVNGGDVLPELIPKTGRASHMIKTGLKYIVAEEDRDIMREFLDLQTLPERMEYETTIVKEYRTTSGHWHMGRFIVKNRNARGHVDKVLYAVNVIDESKQKELNYQRALQDNFKRMAEKNMLLTALTDDYEDVYLCDLSEDTLQVVKEADSQLSDRIQGKQYCYSARAEDFCRNYIESEDGKELLKVMDRKNLMEYFKDQRQMSVQYRVKPNFMGYSHMESRLVRVESQDGFKVVMGSRKIDDIVKKQEEQKKVLQKALDVATKNAEIMGAIATMYDTIFLENLNTKAYEMLVAPDMIGNISGLSGNLDDIREDTLSVTVIPEMMEMVRAFVNPETLKERLKDKDSIALEYKGPGEHWYRGHFIVKKRDSEKRAEEVLFVSNEITQEKRQELEYQNRLIETAQEAEKANATKTDFLRRMSHDIRTPINGIRGMVQIANHYMDDPKKLKECRNKIWTSTDHLLSLVNDVLDMNKLESGELTLKYEPFSLKQILDEVHVVAEMQAQEMGVHFMHQSTQEIEHNYLIGSPVYMKRIFMNFTSNAVKYNRRGGTVNVYGRELSFDGKTAWFEFVCEDTGIGMSEEFQKRAFEPFTQELSQARTQYQGTGLGLAISKSLVELLGGSVELHSVLGEGTKVIFRIPVEVDLEEHEDTKQIDYSSIRFDGISVLLVEDNDLNAEIASFLLEQHGMKSTWVENGRLAVDEITEKPDAYDVIFMDVMMPVMDGLEATRIIRQKLKSKIPVFAMTANAFIDDVQRSLDAGMNAHLTKPLREKDIIQELLKYLTESGKSPASTVKSDK